MLWGWYLEPVCNQFVSCKAAPNSLFYPKMQRSEFFFIFHQMGFILSYDFVFISLSIKTAKETLKDKKLNFIMDISLCDYENEKFVISLLQFGEP